MPRIAYVEKGFRADTLSVIHAANRIIGEYTALGYQLTLRQLYYQFVSRDLIPNQQKEYKRLGSIINDARLAGLIDWNAIEDRTRNLHSLMTFRDPAHAIRTVAGAYRRDVWEGQSYRVEVWVEKEALAGVFQRIADELRLPMFACRGYVSQSEMWSAAQRFNGYYRSGQEGIILHFGDHDPSGIDMTRDIEERMDLFGARAKVIRVALNMDQIEEYDPPPNPAKETDARFASYRDAHGDESWELDALEPTVLADLVREKAGEWTAARSMKSAMGHENDQRNALLDASERWDEVETFLEGK